MLDDKNSYNYQNRNLSEVFKELQEIKNNPQAQQAYSKQANKEKKVKAKKNNIRKMKSTSDEFVSMFSPKKSSSNKNIKWRIYIITRKK